MDKVEPGDIARLKSGGPLLLALGFEDPKLDRRLLCTWVARDDENVAARFANFDRAALVLVLKGP